MGAVKVFVYEFITGGGLGPAPLPASLAREGDMMAQALVRDLAAIPGVEVLLARDSRLPPAPPPAATLSALPEEGALDTFRRGLERCHAAWPVAPETGGTLEALARQTLKARRILLSSRPEAVRAAGSKIATSMVLNAAGIPAVPTFSHPTLIPPLSGPWVVKPDDGAGCEDAWRLSDADSAGLWLVDHPGHVAQPWIEGDALSLSLICCAGDAALLSINRQRLILNDRLGLAGIEVNALSDADGRMALLGGAIAHAIPGLWGYVGVDLVATASGPVVIEVNPRLTTSYCGIQEATGTNPAQWVLDLARGLPLAEVRALVPRPVSLDLESRLAS